MEGRRELFRLLGFLFVFFGGTSSLFASDCGRILELLGARRASQPREVVLSNPGKILVHNHEFAEPISKGFSQDLLRWSLGRLQAEGAFDIPLNENGVMVAASRSNYSQMVWLRDMWRGFAGKLAAGDLVAAKRILKAGLRRESDQAQTGRRLISLLDPSAYKTRSHQEVLPHVVLDPKTLGDSVQWSFQKDAYGFFLHSMLDAEEAGLLSDIPMNERLSIISNFAMLIRLRFWEMKTPDAWEEQDGIYTSSVGVITGAIERFDRLLESGKSGPLFDAYQEFVKNPPVPANMQTVIAASVGRDSIRQAIEKGYETLREHLRGGGEEPGMNDPFGEKKGRTGDTALLWLFFHRLDRFTEEDYRMVLEKVEPLLRPAGMLRYTDPYQDAYLNPAYFFDAGEVVPSELTRVSSVVTGGYIKQAFKTRYTRYIEDVFGKEFAAQWSLGLIVSVQAYASMAEWFPNSADQARYRKKAEDYFLRTLAIVTPGNSTTGLKQDLGVALDGLDVDGYKFPEAISRVKIYAPDKAVKEEVSIFSPFSPLYWATAEAVLAFKKLWKIEIPNEAFPGFTSVNPAK